MEGFKFEFEEKILSYFVDRKLRLRPSAFMEYAQQLAYVGADKLGFGDAAVSKYNVAWILARMHFKYIRTPHRDDKVTLTTWHKGAGPLFFRRDFEILGEDGQRSVVGTSEWIVMDLAERRMVRSSTLGEVVPTTAQCSDEALPESAPKVVPPKGVTLEKVDEHVVRYTDIDINQHANNTRYIAWAMDALDLELTTEHDLSDVYINFNREALPGETVELLHAEADGAHYVEGRAEGAQVFICKIVFK